MFLNYFYNYFLFMGTHKLQWKFVYILWESKRCMICFITSRTGPRSLFWFVSEVGSTFSHCDWSQHPQLNLNKQHCHCSHIFKPSSHLDSYLAVSSQCLHWKNILFPPSAQTSVTFQNKQLWLVLASIGGRDHDWTA